MTDDPLGLVYALDDFEALARAAMTPATYAYVSGGAADEHTLRWNRERFSAVRLRPRVLVDVREVDLSVRLFGRTLPHPILLAPAAYQRAMHPEGEAATARGAGAAGAVFVVSTATTTPIAEVAQAATGPLWFQLYVQADRGYTRDLVAAVEAAGCEALCVTVDTPTIGTRDRMLRAGFQLPEGLGTPHLRDVSRRLRGIIAPEHVALTWEGIEWLRSVATVPVLLKGILDPGDADRAVAAGVDGIVVSNHGARNLDTVPAMIDALGPVAERVAGRVPVLADGGIRRGTDALKALALGASAVLVGRPYCYGLAAAGAAGVARVVEILRRELETAMQLVGCAALGRLDRAALWDA